MKTRILTWIITIIPLIDQIYGLFVENSGLFTEIGLSSKTTKTILVLGLLWNAFSEKLGLKEILSKIKNSTLPFLIIIISLGGSIFFGSCKTQKLPPPEPIVINYEKETTTAEKETISKAIDDKTIIPVMASKSNNTAVDSLVNAKVDDILNKLNYQKQSGDNRLEVKYNALLKQLEINSKIGQTSNKEKDLKSSTLKEVPVIKNVPYPVIQPLTKLQKLLIALGVGTGIFFGVKYGIKLVSFIKGKTIWA